MAKGLGNVYILGDSYSTFEGYIPDGYRAYYRHDGTGTQLSIKRAEDTWWYPLLAQNGGTLVRNDSWSGSCVCTTGYGGERWVKSPFVLRLLRTLKDGICDGKEIDTVIIFGGTNDSWANVPIGDFKYSDWDDEDLACFLPAFCKIADYLKNQGKNLRVITVINTGLKDEIKNGMITVCEKYGMEYIVLKDINKSDGHPDGLGMKQIKEQIAAML